MTLADRCRAETQRDDQLITVCAECLCASCWQGMFLCQRSQNADITHKTVRELRQLNLEPPSYWRTDEELADDPT